MKRQPRQRRRLTVEELDAYTHAMQSLRRARQATTAVFDAEERRLIAAMRHQGATFSQIGATFGATAAAARQRFLKTAVREESER